MQEGATLRREINCATKRAQRVRIDKGHEATVVMARVDYDRHFIHDPDETINALIIIRFANRREVTVLSHPEILYVPSDDERAQAGDDEEEEATVAEPNPQRIKKKRVKRHRAVMITRDLFDRHYQPRVNPLFGRLTVPAGTTDFSPYVNSIVPYNDVIVNLDLQLRAGEDEGTDTSIEADPTERENAGHVASDAPSVESQESEDLLTSGENFLCLKNKRGEADPVLCFC